MSKRIVVDASIARASGGSDATYPTSKNCRDFLQAVLDLSHRCALSDTLRREWNTHQSSFARAWRVSMVARKRLIHLTDVERPALRSALQRHAASNHDMEMMLKDAHLLEVALATDKIVASLDEVARALFANAAEQNVREISPIMWVNPDPGLDDVRDWLATGARDDDSRRLPNL